MPDIMSLALFERGKRTLVVRRKADAPPFAGSWVLPGGAVLGSDAMEESLERHVYHELGVETSSTALDFAETLYLEDPASGNRYVANVFRVTHHQGQLRFRAAGDYADARWLTSEELSEIEVPPGLRRWLQTDRKAAPEPVVAPIAPGGPPPDNRAGWNAISRAYQERYRLPTDRLVYGGRAPDESQLGLLGDVSGRKVIVLGCGGGQDCIVLAKQGADAVGIDLSDKQIEYGRRLADREGVLVTLLQGDASDLGRFGDERFDLALSVHAMNYVEHADRAFAEAFRVLRPGGALVLSVHHPFHACLDDEPPFGVLRSYWDVEVDWLWEFAEAPVTGKMRSWYRTLAQWFELLAGAGFRLERLLEPPPAQDADDGESWRNLGSRDQKSDLIPDTLIMKAAKP